MFFEFALIGTTASGKTELANQLAYEMGACILSLDSLCVYKEIDIASAKVDIATLHELCYFGVNLLSVKEHFNIAMFFKEYEKAKTKALNLACPLIITGGTSFYLKALMDGLSENIEESTSNLNNDEIYALLKQIDPNAKIEKNDSYRLKKWLGIYENTGQIPSHFQAESKKEPLIKNLQIFELTWDKTELEKRIIQRTNSMLEKGLIDEAKYLFNNFDENLKALNSIGLKECKEFLKGKLNKQELKEQIIIHTRQLAKKQRTFNKKFQSQTLEFHNAFDILKDFNPNKTIL